MAAREPESVTLEVDENDVSRSSSEGARRDSVAYGKTFQHFLNPNSSRMRSWESFVIFTIIVGICLELFQVAFSTEFYIIWVLVYLFDLVFLVDIILHFFLGYMKDGILITDKTKLRSHYLRTNFPFDVFTILPIDLLVLIIPGVGAPNIMRNLAIYRCVTRVVRAVRIPAFFEKRESQLGTNTALVRTLRYSVFAGLVIHTTAALWYMMVCTPRHDQSPDCTRSSEGWARSLSANLTDENALDSYVISLYWSVATVTSTGYGDISAVNELEKIYSVIAMIVGIGVFFGLILGGMASMLTNFDAQRANYWHRFTVIKDTLRDQEVPEGLQKQVVGYYEYLWVRKTGATDDSLINILPLTFHAEVSLSGTKYILDKAPMFKGLSDGFLRMLSLEIKPALYLPNQTIACRNEICHNMYYIQRGEVEVLAEDDYTILGSLRHGKLFGEVSLIFSMPRTNTIQAASHCDLMVLEKGDLQKVLLHYPEVAKKLQRIAEMRCDAVGHLQERVRAGEGIIPACKSLKRLKGAGMKVLPPINPSSVHKLKSMETFDIEEDEKEWVTVHRGSVVMHGPARKHPTRFGRYLTICWDELRTRVIDTVILPDSSFAKWWEFFVLFVTLIIAFVYPYCASFIGQKPIVNQSLILLTVMYIMDFILLFDIIFHLRTAVVTPNGTDRDFDSIREHYVKSWGFVLDVLAIIPLDLFCLLYAPESEERIKALYLLSLNRLIKFWRVPNYIKKLEGDLGVNIGNIRFLKFIIYISLSSHWFSCLWYLVACRHTGDCQKDLWNQTSNFVFNIKGSSTSSTSPSSSSSQAESSAVEKYIISLYWAAATMTSTGYGDISAHTTIGRSIALGAMLVGLLLYGYCLSSIAATLANKDTPRVRFQEKLFVVQEFMKDHGVSPELMQSVVSYLSLVFRRHRGQSIPGGPRLMRDMPIQLQQDIAYNDAQETLGKVPLFKDCDSGFLRQLSLQTHAYLFMPGDIVVYEGDMGREMYFIRRGTCEVMSKDMKRVTSTIGPGQYFGEVGLIFGDYRTATVRAASYCEVLMLTRADLDEALKDFPLIAKQFKEAASNREHLLELKSASQRQDDLEEIQDTDDLEADTSVEATSHRKTDASVKVFNKYSDDYLEPFKHYSPFTRLFLKLLMSRVFLPSGRYFQLWEGFRVALSILSIFTVTIQAGFLHMSPAFWIINYILDVIFYIDMYLKFHSAFFNENKVLVTHPLSTAKHYFKTNFLIDLVACFPTELIAYCIIRDIDGYALHTYAVVRLNRLIQFYRVPLAFNYLESGVEISTGNIRKWKFFFYLVLFMHILACVWYFNACPPLFKRVPDTNLSPLGLIETNSHYCRNTSWTSGIESFDFYNDTIVTQYFISLYWAAATGASVGYGDIVAKTQSEMVLALFAMILGIVFFGYIIASVAASLANADAQRARYQEKLTAIQRYLKDNGVEKGLSQRVLDYYNYMWLRTKGVDTDSLFDGLPLSLKADVSLSLYQHMINNVPLFQNTEVGFQKMLAMCIKPVYYLAKEYVVKKHDFGKEMFFIHRGAVDVVSEDGQIVFDTMQAGRFFGEISLVYSCPRTASIRAQTNCDCFVLTKEDLDEVLTHYPSIKVQINQVAEERISAVRKRSDAKDLSNSNNNSMKGSSAANSSKNSLANSDSKEPSSAATSPPAERHEPSSPPASPATPVSSTSSTNNTNVAPSPNTNNNNDAKTKADGGNSQNGKARGGEESNDQAVSDSDGDHPAVAIRQPFPLCCFMGNKNYVETILRTNHFVLPPDSKFVHNLSRLTCALAFCLTWTIIYQFAFQSQSPWFMVFSYLCEVVFLFEIYIKFHVSCADEYGELEKNFNKVYTFYLKKRTGFQLDLVAALPLDIFALCFPSNIRFLTYTILRWIHLLRLWRVSEFFENWEKELNINMLQVRLTKTFVLVVVIIHFFASFWYVIACPPWFDKSERCIAGSWATEANYTSDTNEFTRYWDCLYWAVATLTSTGYGDLHAYSLIEMIVASLVMVIGQLLNGSVLGNIASTLANEEAGRVEYEERLDAVKEQMKDMKLNSKLRNRVISYFDYLWMRNKGVDQYTLLRDAPPCLQAELALYINERHLTKVPIFKDAEASFFRSLTLMLRPVLITPNDYIVRQGDVGDEMYFIHRGTVEVMDENNLQKVAQVLHEGDHFDDINLLYDVPRRTSVRACTHVNLQALSVHDLKQVLEQFPSVEEQVRSIGKSLYGDYAASVNAPEHFTKKLS